MGWGWVESLVPLFRACGGAVRRVTGGRWGGGIWFLILCCITLVYSKQDLSYAAFQRGGWGREWAEPFSMQSFPVRGDWAMSDAALYREIGNSPLVKGGDRECTGILSLPI